MFIDGNLPVYNSVMSASWRGNAMHQTMIRAWTKLEFAWGIATRMAEAINASDPVTQQMLGEIWSYAELTRAAVIAGEQQSYEYGNGAWFLDQRPMNALRAVLPYWFPRVNEIIRLIGSHNVLATPTADQFADPALRPLIDKYLRGAGGRRPRSSGRASSGWGGILPAARWPAATSSTSDSTSRPGPATGRARNCGRNGGRRIGWWTGF